MQTGTWNILIIGDLFVTSEMFRAAIARELDRLGIRAEFREVQTLWPDDPLHDVEEVHEAVGDVAAIAEAARDADIIVTDYGAVTKRIIDSAPNLRLIGVARGGPVSVNVSAANARDIRVVNLPGRNSRAVAEFTVGLIFSQLKRLAECNQAMHNGIWRGDCYRFERAPRELSGQKAGVIGYGHVGRLVADLLSCLDMTVLVYDPFVAPETLDPGKSHYSELDSVLSEADVVSLHARATRENVRMIAEPELRKMKSSAHLINTARGSLVDYVALHRALVEGWIAGAALDIYDVEPVTAGYPLLSVSNVTLTPHIAGSSQETALRSADLVATQIGDYIKENRSV